MVFCKRTAILLLLTLMACFLWLSPTPASAASNLIPNPSVETADPVNANQPQNWSTGYLWGDLDASYSYRSSGAEDGSRSISVSITRYVSGDAKWYFTPVTIQPGTAYTFSDYSISNVTTHLIAQYQNTAGVYSYVALADVPASSTWHNNSVQFTTPSGSINISVFHTLDTIGTLTTDNFSLSPAGIVQPPPPPPPLPLPPPSDGNLISNSSFETPNTSNANLPQGWYQGSWGTNTATFAYLNTGHTGNRSAQVTISRYTNGDAKWYAEPVTITPLTSYQFTDYYQSNVSTVLVAWYVLSDGTNYYVGLANEPSSSVWSKAIANFTSPANAVKLTVFHLLAAKGSLTVDDYNLTQKPIPSFTRGIVSLTFDDGWQTNYTNVLPLLEKYGYPSTQYIFTSAIGDVADGYMTAAQIEALLDAGSELGSHSVTHPYLTKLRFSKMDAELKNSQTTLQQMFNRPVPDFAAPYDDYNNTVVNDAKNYYQSFRTTDTGFNTIGNFDPYHLVTQNIEITTTADQVKQWVNEANTQNLWLILVYHQVQPGNTDQYGTTTNIFSQNLSDIANSGIAVETVAQALSEIKPQL